MENTMNSTIAKAIFAFTAMFAASNATAQDFFKPGVTAATITNKTIAFDPAIHMLVLKSVEKNGDSVMEIQKSENSKEWLCVVGNKVVWGAKAEKWILHKNSGGWSIMLKSNAVMTVGLNKSKNGLELQRNQGYPHQVWDIKIPTASTSKMFVPGTFEKPIIAKGKFKLVEKLPGWKTSDSVFEIWSSGFSGVEAYEGNQFVELNANIDGTLYRESSDIAKGATIEFTFAHRGRNGNDSMKLTMTDLGADNSIGGGDDTQLFVKQYTTGKSAWKVYGSTSEPKISALGNTVRFAYTAVDATDGKGANKSEGNFLDAAHFGVNVVTKHKVKKQNPNKVVDTGDSETKPQLPKNFIVQTYGIHGQGNDGQTPAFIGLNEKGERKIIEMPLDKALNNGNSVKAITLERLGGGLVALKIGDRYLPDLSLTKGDVNRYKVVAPVYPPKAGEKDFFSLELANKPGTYLRHMSHNVFNGAKNTSEVDKVFKQDVTWHFHEIK